MNGEIQSQTDVVKARCRAALLTAMESTGVEIEAAGRARLNTSYPPASKRGESPRKRTGNLQDGVFHYTEETVSGVRTTISYGRAGGDPLVPLYLQVNMNRPFASTDRDEWADKLAGVLPERVRGAIT
jgi:hypothetical protein